MFGKHSAGIYEKAFDPHIGWQERWDSAARLGFDYGEISVDETDERLARLDWSREKKKEMLDAIWNSGVTLRSMCLSGHRRFPFGSKDPNIRERAHDISWRAMTCTTRSPPRTAYGASRRE